MKKSVLIYTFFLLAFNSFADKPQEIEKMTNLEMQEFLQLSKQIHTYSTKNLRNSGGVWAYAINSDPNSWDKIILTILKTVKPHHEYQVLNWAWMQNPEFESKSVALQLFNAVSMNFQTNQNKYHAILQYVERTEQLLKTLSKQEALIYFGQAGIEDVGMNYIGAVDLKNKQVVLIGLELAFD